MLNKRTYKIFDKMKSKYSSDVYTIIKVNKKNCKYWKWWNWIKWDQENCYYNNKTML